MEFKQILDKYRRISFSERDKGDRFERLMQSYLLTDPQYSTILKHVWMWNEFPSRKDFGGQDIGIDLVAKTYEGDYWAIQCKCYQDTSTINKHEVDSFLSTSSRQFQDVHNLNRVGFSNRLWISTTNHWGSTAEETIRNQNPPVSRLNQYQLELAPVDWEKIEQGLSGEPARLKKKKIRDHQKVAIEETHKHFKEHDRGKLIMACGTGKTYTSLKIAEHETNGSGFILFLVPSISLLGQTLREWSSDAEEDISPIAICSDPKITKKRSQNDDSDSISIIDLALPASTNVDKIIHQFYSLEKSENKGLKVVFSTYQSIDVIANAQTQYKSRFPQSSLIEFDMIICDEAHRTTGVSLTKEDSSSFIKVHDNDFIKSKKRLYMTATPRLYSDESKSKAIQKDAILCSMDDEKYYGKEIYRIGFGEAVEKDLLSDYKVLILTLSEDDVPESIQKMISNEEHEIDGDDASKLIGCINALSKQVLGDEGVIKDTDPDPMKRAVAFCQNIKISKHITRTFNTTADIYIESLSKENQQKMVSIDSRHIDGSMSAPERDELLGWLKGETEDGECKVLTNVRCLSEGVDVPNLDSVLFLSARNSQVDVVQSVGRVMRKDPLGKKKYGYIIIPVLIPSDIEPSKALDDNKRYQVVWSVLNALRAHDDRFNATINKIELNKKKPKQIIVGGIGGDRENNDESGNDKYGDISHQFSLQFEELQSVVYAKMVQKVGDRLYWEQWAKSVAEIAERQIERITRLSEQDGNHQKIFKEFLTGLRNNINPSVSKQEAIEMLSQHLITKPVFEALFNNYSFVQNNPISISMQKMVSLLESQSIEKDTKILDSFYSSVRKRAEGIDNSEGKQRIIIELYDKFFKTAFPKMVERLGIVYTPVEVVDFIINSVDDVLKKEFGRSLSDENVNIIDPFTGTGTFIVRLIQSGLIKSQDLYRKYKNELFANEIVLLAYYIATVNIENAFHDLYGKEEYHSFDGICLTDTFQLGETGDEGIFSSMFPENTERVTKQKKSPIKVIIGNPPYSVGQKSANDNAQNQSYRKLENRTSETYVKNSTATNKNSLYDSYIKAFRWSTDRLDPVNGGVICFVSNGSWIDGNSQDGFRKSLEEEFSSIYVFNLRGNARTSGELRRKEKDNVFGMGTRTTISITLLIKNPKKKNSKSQIYYHDIGDYLSLEEKLDIIKESESVLKKKIKFKKIDPNRYGDWINFRNDHFSNFISIGDKKNKTDQVFFTPFYSNGVKTNRDSWTYNSNKSLLVNNIKRTLNFYNSQVDFLSQEKCGDDEKLNKIEYNSKNFSWDRQQKFDVLKQLKYQYSEESLRISTYRPFFKQHLYFHKKMNNMVYLMPKLYPSSDSENLVICIPAPGSKKDFSVLISSNIPDIHLIGDTQCFPLYYYEENKNDPMSLFDHNSNTNIKRDGVTDFILSQSKSLYGKRVVKEDIFYYVYGLLHHKPYRETFNSDLKKSLPNIPLVEQPSNFWTFSKKGRELAYLHLNYESISPSEEVSVIGEDSKFFKVQKMSFIKKGQKDTILFNSKITISNIPTKAYEYIVNGKSAIEWIMERYQFTINKESGIKNDPNDWAEEVGNPRYILDLLLSIINVSVQTVDIVNSLPELKFE